MTRIFILATYIGPVGTMGGHMKILFEILNNLSDTFQCIVITGEAESVRVNTRKSDNVIIEQVENHHKHMNALQAFDVLFVAKKSYDILKKHNCKRSDIVFSATDFAPDLLSAFVLQRIFHFFWLSSFYLFVPNPIQNLKEKYGFPFFRYCVYWIYQKFIFIFLHTFSQLAIITNDSDRKYFSDDFQKRIFAFYGGVNLEQIQKRQSPQYDAVFCSRLHPQKGPDLILRSWQLVVQSFPHAKLALIGNGDPQYESTLRALAQELGIESNITWLGYLNGTEKYSVYSQSKMFLHGSVFDNNGMVAAEALCSGLPVVMYDHPQLRSIYTDNCAKVSMRRYDLYAKSICDILRNPFVINEKAVLAYQKKWSWISRTALFRAFLQQRLNVW